MHGVGDADRHRSRRRGDVAGSEGATVHLFDAAELLTLAARSIDLDDRVPELAGAGVDSSGLLDLA